QNPKLGRLTNAEMRASPCATMSATRPGDDRSAKPRRFKSMAATSSPAPAHAALSEARSGGGVVKSVNGGCRTIASLVICFALGRRGDLACRSTPGNGRCAVHVAFFAHHRAAVGRVALGNAVQSTVAISLFELERAVVAPSHEQLMTFALHIGRGPAPPAVGP